MDSEKGVRPIHGALLAASVTLAREHQRIISGRLKERRRKERIRGPSRINRYSQDSSNLFSTSSTRDSERDSSSSETEEDSDDEETDSWQDVRTGAAVTMAITMSFLILTEECCGDAIIEFLEQVDGDDEAKKSAAVANPDKVIALIKKLPVPAPAQPQK